MLKTKISASNIINLLYCLLLISLTLSLVLTLLVIFSYYKVVVKKTWGSRQPVSIFKDCQSLSSACNNESCQYVALCGGSAANYANCQVYDCGEKYGVEISANDGKLLTKSYDKPKVEDAKKAIADCEGTVKVIDNKCDKNVAARKITAEVATSGECKVGTFMYQQYGDWKPAVFTNPADDKYSLVIPSCEPITAINAISEGGRLIGSQTLNK